MGAKAEESDSAEYVSNVTVLRAMTTINGNLTLGTISEIPSEAPAQGGFWAGCLYFLNWDPYLFEMMFEA